MRASGNGRPEICASNLKCIVRGEVPYERLKGLSREIIDAPSTIVTPQAKEDITWTINTYEPRVAIENIEIVPNILKEGQFLVTTSIVEGGAP